MQLVKFIKYICSFFNLSVYDGHVMFFGDLGEVYKLERHLENIFLQQANAGIQIFLGTTIGYWKHHAETSLFINFW